HPRARFLAMYSVRSANQRSVLRLSRSRTSDAGGTEAHVRAGAIDRFTVHTTASRRPLARASASFSAYNDALAKDRIPLANASKGFLVLSNKRRMPYRGGAEMSTAK